jgi:hypothetical protein
MIVSDPMTPSTIATATNVLGSPPMKLMMEWHMKSCSGAINSNRQRDFMESHR